MPHLGGLDPIDTYSCCSSPPLEGLGEEDYIALAAEVPSRFGSFIEKLAREMWEKKATEAGFEPELVQAYGERLSEAVTKGYSKDFFEMDFTEPDYDKLKNLHIDAWKFATGKSQDHLDMLTKALRKPDGSMRTFEEFRIQTVIATGKQLRGLKAEYNTAVASAQMASKWEEIQRMKATYPYLEFVAVMDDHVTDKCARLDGVIRHVDDPFWREYYPPNHYNCRSTVKQLRRIPEGYQDLFEEPNIPADFKTDFVMRGHLFPADHKYYGMTPNELFNKVREHLPYDLQFDKIELPEGAQGYLQQHYLADTSASDYRRVLEIAVEKAVKGEKVDIMPELNPNKWADLRKIIFPDAKRGSSADLRITGVLWEEEGVTVLGKNTVSDAIKDGSRQAHHLIISILTEDYPGDQYLFNKAKGAFNIRRYLNIIEFRHKEHVYAIENPYKSKAD